MQGIYRVTVERLGESEGSCDDNKDKESEDEQSSTSEGEAGGSQSSTARGKEKTPIGPDKQPTRTDSGNMNGMEPCKPRTLEETKKKYRLVYHDINFVSDLLR